MAAAAAEAEEQAQAEEEEEEEEEGQGPQEEEEEEGALEQGAWHPSPCRSSWSWSVRKGGVCPEKTDDIDVAHGNGARAPLTAPSSVRGAGRGRSVRRAGQSNVGKSSIAEWYVHNQFKELESTIGGTPARAAAASATDG